jgi:hypothetical protein
MPKNTPHFNFLATGIGSVPFLDVDDTCNNILENFPAMPFWPQFVRRSYLEDMSVQYSEGLPLLVINEKEKSLMVSSSSNAEHELTIFYEHFLAGDLNYFSIGRDYAPGLYSMLDISDRNTGCGAPYFKGQTVGPVTFAAGILDTNGKPILHNPELLEAMVSGLAIKALWQVKELAKSGKNTILFIDEPYLSGFGSAFSPIQRHEVIDILRKMIGYIREHSDALLGIHCCGNTDWPMIIESGIDIINFDAFEYMDHFLLYPVEIARFINSGGTLAWGILPTAGFTGEESLEGLFLKIKEGLHRVYKWGIDPEMLTRGSILTPACGMGTMDPEAAIKGMALLSRLSQKCEDEFVK